MFSESNIGQSDRGLGRKDPLNYFWVLCSITCIALRNIQNHINAVGAENLDLRVVMHGNGVSLLLEPDQVENTKMKAGNADENMTARISNLKDQGVTFKICANTLKGRKIDLEYLFDASEDDIVPSGVAEIAHLQAEGFSYLRP